jgi:hypothetical protein
MASLQHPLPTVAYHDIMEALDFTIFTKQNIDLSSIENRCFSNDFDINEPVDFNVNHLLEKDVLVDCQRALKIVGIKDPTGRIDQEAYQSIKNRIFEDAGRLISALDTMGFCHLEQVLFVTIGNSMESYGFVLSRLFKDYHIGHIKVSRTLKDAVERGLGKDGRFELFNEYFCQKIIEIIERFGSIETVVIIDTFAAGETMSTILHHFVHQGIKYRPGLKIFPACLLEGGSIRPNPPYDENVEIIHYPQAKDYLGKLALFKQSRDDRAILPVLSFNEYIPVDEVVRAINESDGISTSNCLIKRFGLKKIKIFIETQKIFLHDRGYFIVIPSGTTRLLSPINPYFTVAQKTVFIARDDINSKFVTRDGFGYSRQEKPPFSLHRLNNHEEFRKLPVSDKMRIIFKKEASLFNLFSDEVKGLLNNLDTNDLELAEDAFESYLRKQIIYHQLWILEHS